MLTGTIKYFREDIGKYEIFNVIGIDSSSSFQGIISTGSYRALDFLENEKNSDGLLERRFAINLSSVKVQTRMKEYDDNGTKYDKPKKHQPNMDFFLKIGSAIRYAKSHCYKKYSVKYTGLQVATSEFLAETKATYRIPLDKENETDEDKYLGEVSLYLGEIQQIYLKTDEYEIDLIEDEEAPKRIFYSFTTAVTKGFKFDTEHLGFYIKPPQKNQTISKGLGYYTTVEDIIKNNPDKDLQWLLTREYYIVDDDMLPEVMEYFWSQKNFLAMDTETTGLTITFKSRIGQADQCTGIILCAECGKSYYFPLQHKLFPNMCNNDHWYFMEHYMKPLLETKDLVCHNMVFDWKVCYIYGINANILHDTMLLFRLTIGNEKEDLPLGLKELTELFLRRSSLSLGNLVTDNSWGESEVTFDMLPKFSVKLYAPADGDNTLELLYYALKADLLGKYNANKVYEIEVLFALAVAYQEFYGHCFDVDKVDQLKKEVTYYLGYYKEKMADIAGYSFNPDSPQQLSRVMYDELKIPQVEGKGRSTDKKVLKALLKLEDSKGNCKYPFIEYLKEYRDYSAIRKTFLKRLNELSTPDGYLHSKVGQTKTTTGRLSTSEPNYQGYNDTVKKYIIPRPNFVHTDNDYSSIEYRVLPSMAKQQSLITAFNDPELNYHTYQASRIFGVPYESVSDELRHQAKGVNFGLPYGMEDESLGETVYGEKSKENTRKAGILRKRYFEGQEQIQAFFEEVRDNGVKNGYTETYFGRRRYYHKEKFSENAIRRQAGNHVIQGTAADLYKIAVGRLFTEVCRRGWLGKVLFTAFVHDEILCEVHESIDPVLWMSIVKEAFEMKPKGFCNLYIGFGYGMSWYQAKKTEIPTKLQAEFIENWKDTGYPNWKNTDNKEFCDSIPTIIRDYEIRAVIESITAEENQGGVIKPTINTYLHNTLKEDTKIISKGYLDFIKDFISPELYNALLKGSDDDVLNAYSKFKYNVPLDDYLGDRKHHTDDILLNKLESIAVSFKNLVRDRKLNKHYIIKEVYENNNINSLNNTIVEFLSDRFKKNNIHTVPERLPIIGDLQECLDSFCMLHSVDKSKVDLHSASADSTADLDTGSLASFNEELNALEEEKELEGMKYKRVRSFGIYTDEVSKELILLVIPNANFMALIKDMIEKGGGTDYKIKLFVNDDNIQITPMTCSARTANELLRMYLMYFSKIKAEQALATVK